MKSGGKSDEIRIPDVELLIQAAQSDVALVSFYISTKPPFQMEVVCAVTDTDEVGPMVEVLKMAISCLLRKDWKSVDELDAGDVEKLGGQQAP